MSGKENTPEEIDLGHLFRLFGNAFNRFTLFISGIFKGVFNLIIGFLQFIRVHFIKLVISVVLGFVIGWYLDYVAERVYRSSMVVEPNFNSAQQLYNNIEFYNGLAEQDEFAALATALQITNNEAKTIKRLEIKSFSDENLKIKQFSEFIRGLDSISVKMVNYDTYLKNFNNLNAKFHKISIESTNPKVAKKSQFAILKSIENNEYFKLQKVINDTNIILQDDIIKKQLLEIDSLQRFYKKLKLLEATKPEGGTNINLGDKSQGSNSEEIKLLLQSRELKENQLLLNNKKANTKSTVNVISEFPNKGMLVNDFFRMKKVILPLLFVVLLVIVLSMLALNKYLKNYK